MTNPRNLKSLSGATSAGSGNQTRLNGHYQMTLFVAVDGTLDTSNDTLDVDLEGSPDGTRWDVLASLSASDFSQDDDSGEYVAHVSVSDTYVEFMRANIAAITDASGGDLGNVDAYVMAGGNPGHGTRGVPDAP